MMSMGAVDPDDKLDRRKAKQVMRRAARMLGPSVATSCPSTRARPPVAGMSATSDRLSVNVWSSSCAIHPARSSQLHCVQYRIVTRGL